MGKQLLFVSAGDPSGDNATSHLLTSLKEKHADLETFGLGGPKMKELGQEQLADSRDLAVLGFWEVAKRYLFFRRLFKDCVRQIKERQPSCILLVDYPGFNLRLAEKIKPLGIPIVYYISPQVWAWHKKRVHQIKRLVDLMMVILPFEKPFFDNHDVPSEMVGHYLLEDIAPEFIGSDVPESNQLALLPGSRPQEIERMLEPMLEVGRRMYAKHGMKAVVAGVRGAYDYDRLMKPGDSEAIEIRLDDARRIVKESRLVVTASGTATLETGIIGRPMVVIYKTGFITYQIARRLVKLEMIALVNLVLGKKVVPELIQGDANPDMIVEQLERYLADNSYFDEVARHLRTVPTVLGGEGASERAAELVGRYL